MNHKLLLTLWGVALILMGCTADVEITPTVPTPDGAIAINIDGSINQTYTTRVDDGGFCDGDQIGLYGVNYTDNNSVAGELLDEGNQVDNVRYIFDEENMKWTPSRTVYYKDAQTKIDLYGYYPYANVESVSAYKFEVAQDQSGANAIDGYAMSDFLWGKAKNISPTANKVRILFNHMLSCANVILAEGDGFAEGEFAALKKSVLAMSTTRTAEIDLATGMVTASGDAESEGIVMKGNGEGFRAIVVPQSVDAGKPLFAITVDGVSYRFKKDIDFTYEAGKQSKFTIQINKKEHSEGYEFVLINTEIVDWVADLDSNGGEARQYYVVHLDEAGTLEAKLYEAKKDPTKIKNLKISGKINANDFYYMRDNMPKLQALNLRESEICALYGYHVGFYDGTEIAWFDEKPEDLEAALNEHYPGKGYSLYNTTPFIDCDAHQIPNGAFMPCDEYGDVMGGGPEYLTEFVFPKKVVKIGNDAFNNRQLLAGPLNIPEGVVEIGKNAFGGCAAITSLSLPSTLQKIGDWAFAQCTLLSGELLLPNSITSIGAWCFYVTGGSKLTGSLNLPESLQELEEAAFSGCRGFTGSLTIPQSLTKIPAMAFSECSGLNGQLILHDGITDIGESAFRDCAFQGELKLPSELAKISQGCFWGTKFTSIAGWPEGLVEIESYAFHDTRLTGSLTLPNSLISLGEEAFSGCGMLEEIVLPKNLVVIGSRILIGSNAIHKLTCQAIEPPILYDGAFDGLNKDNFTLEVPEQSINRYKSTPGWNDFVRIEAHYDFSVSRRLMRTLNAERSRQFILRAPANYAWSIESHPDWVRVSPSSGVGKTEITVTVNNMSASDVGVFEINTGTYYDPKYETNRGRKGEIVFLLNDKNYRTTMTVEQYDYNYVDGDVITHQTATIGDGVNLVFLGDCFDARDIARGAYLSSIQEAIEHFFDIEPYKTYRDYFNVYTVFGMSDDSGMGTENTIRNAKFGSQYLYSGVQADYETSFEYALKCPTVNSDNLNKGVVVMLQNTTEYPGGNYFWTDGTTLSFLPMTNDSYPYDFRGKVQHIAGGKGFGHLGPEYVKYNSFPDETTKDEIRTRKSLGWYKNISLIGSMDEVDWLHLIFHPTYSDIVDVYEGGCEFIRGVFRSEPISCMNSYIPYFNAISRQAIVERIMDYANIPFNIDEFYANDVLEMPTQATRASIDLPQQTVNPGEQITSMIMGDKPQLNKSNN